MSRISPEYIHGFERNSPKAAYFVSRFIADETSQELRSNGKYYIHGTLQSGERFPPDELHEFPSHHFAQNARSPQLAALLNDHAKRLQSFTFSSQEQRWGQEVRCTSRVVILIFGAYFSLGV